MNRYTALSSIIAVAVLSACGGGGGGSSPAATPPVASAPAQPTPAPKPAPVAAPAALVCNGASGGGQGGISFHDPLNAIFYQFTTTAANALDFSTFTFGVANTNPVGTFSGSLVTTLWAIPASYVPGTTLGGAADTNMGLFIPLFVGPGAASASQVFGQSTAASTTTITNAISNPPAGQYCIVATLDEYIPSACPSSSGIYKGYCNVDWVQFQGAVTFK